MNWSDIKEAIAGAAPLVGAALGGPGGAAVGSLVASALGVDGTPQAVQAALHNDPDAAVKLRELELEHASDLRRMTLEAETARLAEINRTMRVEAAASDPYVRRWRPTFGYVASLTWTVQIGATAYAVVASPAEAAGIIQAVTALTPMWGIALAVLGISITKRSQDKQVAAGQQPAGLVQAIARRITPGDIRE